MSDSEEYTSGTYGIEMLSQALEAGCHESEECLGCQCCVCWTGQIHCKIANEYQRKEKKKLKRYDDSERSALIEADRWLRQAWDRHVVSTATHWVQCSVCRFLISVDFKHNRIENDTESKTWAISIMILYRSLGDQKTGHDSASLCYICKNEALRQPGFLQIWFYVVPVLSINYCRARAW